MQKYSSIIAVIFSSSVVFCQRSIDSLLQAEKNFANTSLTVSTNEAFIKFIETSGVVFDKGKPVNGLEFYKKRERKPGILSWEPEYTEISSTNDFGYTTGPWKFYANSLEDNPVARGHFITVWHLNNNGEWKFLIDFGIAYSEERKAMPVRKIQVEEKKIKDGDLTSLKQVEEKFIRSYTTQGIKAYKSYLSTQSRINYAGFFPATTGKERKAILDSLPRNINYTILGSGMSPMGGLGYVYGSAVINEKQEGYLRIWRKEKNGWKIAVEVLNFK